VFGAFYLLRLCRRRLEVSVPSFFGDVPWLPAVVCGVGNFALEAILSPWLPGGAVGLLSCAVAAAPAFAAYFVLTLGPRRVAGILTARLPARLRRATA
jgi:hypothetical protein